MSMDWIKLKEPPFFPGLLPAPTCYISPNDGREYWIITPHSANSQTVVQYDVQNDTYHDLIDYPRGFSPNCHGSSFDAHTNELYLYTGYSRHFGIFNIKTQLWDIKWLKAFALTAENEANYNIPAISKVSTAFIPAPINEHHLFGFNTESSQSQHLKYDQQAQKFVVLKVFDCNITRPKMVWIEKQNKLMLFGGECNDTNEIYYCDIDANTTVYEWHVFEVKLPFHNNNSFEAIVVFESIVIVVFYGSGTEEKKKNEIWCLDLITTKWIKSEIESPPTERHRVMHLVQTSDKYLHCIRFASDNNHYKIKLADIIPQTMQQQYSKQFFVVIQAFCKEALKDIPADIIKLVLKYYPIFF